MKRKKHKSIVGFVRDMAHDGSAVVQTDGGVVLSVGGQPGERVRIKVLDARKGVRRGRVNEVLEPAASRVPAFCPELARCGGCAWGEMRLETQRQIKRRWIADAVQLAPERVEVLCGVAEGYRRRARWAWKKRGARVEIGYRPRRSRDVVAVSACPVLVPALERALHTLREQLAPELSGAGEIEGMASAEQVGIFIRSEEPQPPRFYEACRALVERGFVGVVVQVEGVAPAVFGERHMTLCIHRDGQEIRLRTEIGGFAQGNGELNDALVQRVVESCPVGALSMVDLYAGSGNLTLPLASLAPAALWAVETDSAALEACRSNLDAFCSEQLGANATKAKFLNLAADTAIEKLPSRIDVLVLDPPREGAGVGVMKQIARRRIERVIYVSCNPSTLARDLRALEGHKVVRATMVDMFPNTPHAEAVVLLERSVNNHS